ncbi:MAG: hypothetical protein R8G66_20180 [Cytophagales bacterium]|nr:hypothetical protein [Cytophagales bacterium]
MKNKKNLYFLVPAVLFIWGFIIYRIVDFTSDGETDFAPRTYVTPLRESQEAETYQLKSRYPDPFLKQLASAEKDNFEEDDSEKQTQLQETPVPEQPLDIKYRGFIAKSGTDTRIALMVIEGTEVFLKSGERYQSYVIDTIVSDSLAVIVEGKKRWVRKE